MKVYLPVFNEKTNQRYEVRYKQNEDSLADEFQNQSQNDKRIIEFKNKAPTFLLCKFIINMLYRSKVISIKLSWKSLNFFSQKFSNN